MRGQNEDGTEDAADKNQAMELFARKETILTQISPLIDKIKENESQALTDYLTRTYLKRYLAV